MSMINITKTVDVCCACNKDVKSVNYLTFGEGTKKITIEICDSCLSELYEKLGDYGVPVKPF